MYLRHDLRPYLLHDIVRLYDRDRSRETEQHLRLLATVRAQRLRRSRGRSGRTSR